MLYNDFKQLQDQLVDILVNYSKFLKIGAKLNYKYNSLFKDEIVKDFKIRNENTILANACAMLNDKKSLEEVDKFVEDYKKNYENDLNKLNQNLILADSISNNELKEEEQKTLEDHFEEMVRKYHPLLRMEKDNNYIRSFELLQLLYQQDNYQSYFALFETISDSFKIKDYHGVDYEKYLNFYMNLMQKITLDTKERKNDFPYTKEEVFENERSIAREKGEFRAKNTKLLEANKALHADFVELYGEDIKL